MMNVYFGLTGLPKLPGKTLSKPIRKRRSASHVFESLPLEVMLIIVDNLEACDRINLMWSCGYTRGCVADYYQSDPKFYLAKPCDDLKECAQVMLNRYVLHCFPMRPLVLYCKKCRGMVWHDPLRVINAVKMYIDDHAMETEEIEDNTLMSTCSICGKGDQHGKKVATFTYVTVKPLH